MLSVEVCTADSTTNPDSDSTVMFSDSEGPNFISDETDESCDDNNGI